MRSLLFLCLLTVASCKPGAVYIPAVPYGFRVALASSELAVAVPAAIGSAIAVMPQSPGISTFTEYEGISPYYPSAIPIVADSML